MAAPERRAAPAVRPLLLLLLTVLPATADFTTSCPDACKCMWVSGKRQADCTDIGLTSVPRGLSSDIQVLDLSGTAIQELPKDVFRQVGLEHLQKLYIRRSRLSSVHPHAFRGLGLLIELDLSDNVIEKLPPDAFADNDKLRQLLLAGNPLGSLPAFQFPPLPHLQRLDLSRCRIAGLAAKTFANLPELEKLNLHSNELSVLESDALQSLSQLKWLTLHNNPWRCDCHLRLLRDWLLERSLYQEDTRCAEPERLASRSWSGVRSDEFACRPQIQIPEPHVVAEVGQNVTLRCQISGNPAPTTNWVMSGRIISNNTRIPFTGQSYVIHEQGTVDRWTSLTVTNVNTQDAGQYLCVGVNPGGVVERNVTLTFAGGAVPGPVPGTDTTIGGGGGGEGGMLSRPLLLGIVVGGVALLLLLLMITLVCCYCRGRRHGGKGAPDELPSDMTAPVTEHKPDRIGDYEKVPQTDIEMERVRRPAGLAHPPPRRAGSYSVDDERSRRYSLPDSPMTWDGRRARDYPDLLPRRAGRSSPAGSSTGSVQPEQAYLLAGPQPRLAPAPAARGVRPGYVTLPRPRRQRTPSWGSTASRGGGGVANEPIYDTLGPRTTADGSSRLSLSAAGPDTLPPYYVAVEGPPPPRGPARSHNASADLIEPVQEEPEEWEETPPQPLSSTLPLGLADAASTPSPPSRVEPVGILPPPSRFEPGNLQRKVTPPVPPKPKKITPPVMPKPVLNGTRVMAFQDESEDGTEV
ncbi:leucine-rich repeat-containing protein 24-like [Amphibalanus amphitrite]|nr:leucine-rich repeat-containing protein 24-like [Amphibalanus amphitrite]XP_043191775.1 leucine-rich repeat-containing protein 24-like [Amphibalanus amphitrite]XP_043191776.1 leucine-rich repeat-containing protein 24-like [Amphibalanus amphitrite]